MTRQPVESATNRVERLLTMVPWLASRQGIEIERAAAGLGITEKQLRADLDLLFMCGYGPMPDELIEASYEGGRVFVSNADAISRPLRLTVDEATSLIVGLRSLAASGAGESSAVERALSKLEGAAGAIPGVDRVLVVEDDTQAGHVLADLRDALAAGRRVHLGYHVPSRDERTERDVDPMRLARVEGHWYLEGWCHRARDLRLFRIDRIEAVDVLDVPADPPEGLAGRDLRTGVYQGGAEDVAVLVRLAPGAHWVAEYYPVTDRTPDGDHLLVTMPSSTEGFMQRLVLRLGGGVEVLEPASLRSSVAAHARSALAAYRT
ncbi:helix-turn-helix transcriptional regulator [Janibacter cremeus]|uniref:Proteasome accessory factor C n=1 Tax=Janibacter cremeus TaxID=1285192 RepID=A0A852VKN8_9MICO|nr:WYL domain-containing protein [Janibacter cremeus]NYF96626.1 proteasome accessory factor C [Janibacter cremeus]